MSIQVKDLKFKISSSAAKKTDDICTKGKHILIYLNK